MGALAGAQASEREAQDALLRLVAPAPTALAAVSAEHVPSAGALADAWEAWAAVAGDAERIVQEGVDLLRLVCQRLPFVRVEAAEELARRSPCRRWRSTGRPAPAGSRPGPVGDDVCEVAVQPHAPPVTRQPARGWPQT